jgi:Bacterial Ig-like domain (group 3)
LGRPDAPRSRALGEFAEATARTLRSERRATIGRLAFAVGAIFFFSFGAAQATGGTTSTTSLTSSPNPSQANQQVTFTATVAPQSGGGTPTGTVTFVDDTDASVFGSATLTTVGGQQQATITFTFTVAENRKIEADYGGDNTFATSNSPQITQRVGTITGTTTTLTSSPNPSAVGQSSHLHRNRNSYERRSGSDRHRHLQGRRNDDRHRHTVIRRRRQRPNRIHHLDVTAGSHSITAVYSGAANFTASGSAALVQTVNSTSDSTKLREMQVSTTPIIALAWGQTVSGAIGDAITAGFGSTPQTLSPNGTGFTYYFNDDPPAQPSAETDQDSLNRFLASPDGSAKRVDDDFRSLASGYSGQWQPRRRRRPPLRPYCAIGSPGFPCAAPIISAAHSATTSKATRLTRSLG